MKNKSLITLIAISFLIFFGLIFSVYKITTKKAESFYTNGYISISDFSSSKKIYFDEGTSYKRGYSKQLIFKDNENVKREVPKDSFVFYSDKSINYLSDGVLMDLKGLDGEFIPYYNIKSNYLIEYKDGRFVIDAKEKDIVLNNFIGRINEQKYLVAGNNLKLKVSSSEKMITGYYFELNFGEGNLVKIDNDELSLETASDECYIMVGDDIKIDLSKKVIYYKDEEKANLLEIIIDNDANIDIEYAEKQEGGGSGEGGEEEGNTTPGGQTVTEDTEYKPETVIEYKSIPYVEIINSNTSAHQIALDFRVIDTNRLITGSVKVRYTNLKTGYTEVKEYNSYAGTINYIIDNLASNSDYMVTIYASYMRSGTLYADYRMFQRVFTTKTLGVTLAKDYTSSSEIAYNVTFDEDANYESITISLYDKTGHKIDSKTVNRTAGNSTIIFDGLNSDERYNVAVESFNHGNITYMADDFIESVATTLKKNPFKSSGTIVSNPTAIINKKDYNVIFSLGEITDPNNAVQSITYNIYNAKDNSLVDSIKKDDLADFEIKFGDKLKAFIDDEAQTYYFNAIVSMDDNEKLIDYKTPNSNSFNMDAKIYPTIRYTSELLTANTARGNFVITDMDNTIDISKQVYVEYTDSLGTTGTKNLEYTTCPETESATSKCINMYLDALNSSETYTLNLMAYVDTKDKDVTPGMVQIGAVKIVTEKADIILANITSRDLEIEEATSKMFELSVNFSIDEATNEAIRDNMSSFDIMLYEGSDVTGIYLATMHIDQNIVSDYFENTKVITLSDFNLTIDDIRNMHIAEGTQISQRYTVRLTNGISGSDYVEFKPYTYTFEINSALLDILNGDCEIQVTPILNGSLGSPIEELNDTTFVGLKVTPTFANKFYAKKINITIVDVTNNYNNYELTSTNNIKKSFELNLENNSVIPEYEFLMSDESLYLNNAQFLKRGRVYRVMYTIELDLNGDNVSDVVYPFSNNDVTKPEPVVSDPIEVPKQLPTMMIFPWVSDTNSITYKYHADDIDASLPENYNVVYDSNGTDFTGQKVTCANPSGVNNYTSKYDCVKLTSLTAGSDYNVYVVPKLIDGKDSEKLLINSYVFEGTHSISNLSYSILRDEHNNLAYNNLLVLKVNDSSDENKTLNTVAYYALELSIDGGSKKLLIDNITGSKSSNPLSSNLITYTSSGEPISWTSSEGTTLSKTAFVSDCDENGGTCIYVDYAKLYTSNKFKSVFTEFRNKTINVSLSAYYDSGVVGYSAGQGQKYAIQVISSNEVIFKSQPINNKYFILNKSNANNDSNIEFTDSALSAVYLYDIAEGGFVDDKAYDNDYGKGKMYFINSIYTNLRNSSGWASLDYRVDAQGIIVSLGTRPGISVPVVAKKLNNAIVGTDQSFTFDRVVPSLNINLSLPTLNGIKLGMALSGVTEEEITVESGKRYLYLEVYDINNTLIKTIKINKDNLTSQRGTIQNNNFAINIDDDYKIELVTVKVNNADIAASEYSYDYKTGNIVFKENTTGTIDVTYRIVIDNLIHASEYMIKAYTKMDGVGKVYLSGHNNTFYENKYDTLEHSFTTKDPNSVTIQNAKYDVESDLDYATRRLVTTYNIDDIIGIDNLAYEICNSNNICVDATKYVNCSDDYNHFDGSCFSKENGYGVTIKHDISIAENYDFEFNTNYTLKISAKVLENDLINTYEIYNEGLLLRPLVLPTINVVKKSHFDNNHNPFLIFEVTFKDDDRVVSIPTGGINNGSYSVYLASGSEKIKVVNTEDILNIVQDNSVYTASIRYDNLNTLTEYYLIVEYNTHANNIGSSANQVFSIPYLIYTLDNNGVSIGKLEYQAQKTATILKFGYATNILEEQILDENNQLIDDPLQEAYVAGINYTITRKSGDNLFKMDGSIIFNNSHITIKEDDSSLGDKYYELVINHGIDDEYVSGYPVTAGYNIIFKFYLGGNIAKDLNTESLCLDNNVSNIWDNVKNKCYILDTGEAYKADTIYGG